MNIEGKLGERLGAFQKVDFADRELRRRFALAERTQKEGRQRRALEHRALMSSVMGSSLPPAQQSLPYSLRRYYATQFMTEEWLTHPGYIDGTNWLVTPRPLGTRCLLIASQGLTISITRNGALLHSFQSPLPNGSEGTGRKQEYTVLDTVFSEESGTYYAVDMLTWNGVGMYDHPAEFRLLLCRQYLRELSCDASEVPLSSTPLCPCTPESIQYLYDSQFPFRKDGLLFFRDTGEYVLGVSPEVLLWKDKKSSPYPVDDGETQKVTLHLGNNGRLMTLDKVCLHSLPDAVITEHNLHHGSLVVLSIDGVDFSAPFPTVLNPTFKKVASKQKLKADQWSRVLFQSIARNGGISLSALLAAAAQTESPISTSKSPVLYSSSPHIGATPLTDSAHMQVD